MGYLLILSPLICLVFGIFLFKGKILYVSFFSFFVSILVGKFYWGMYFNGIGGAILKSLFISLDISLIIFGAMLFLEYMRKKHVI
ncbi:MAG TPA: L-lactate permease, partial [bacterium]|nr:L-lactate permease [bacterium]